MFQLSHFIVADFYLMYCHSFCQEVEGRASLDIHTLMSHSPAFNDGMIFSKRSTPHFYKPNDVRYHAVRVRVTDF
jgi:hypothetical protein